MQWAVIKKDKYSGIRRKIYSIYRKYDLITSHICRISFATNLCGKAPVSVITSVCGWESEKKMLNYIKKSSTGQASVLKDYWDKKYSI